MNKNCISFDRVFTGCSLVDCLALLLSIYPNRPAICRFYICRRSITKDNMVIARIEQFCFMLNGSHGKILSFCLICAVHGKK